MRITPDEIESGLLEKLRRQPRFGALLSAHSGEAVEVPVGVADKLARAATAVAGMLVAQVGLLLVGRALARANAAVAIAFLLFALFVPTMGAVYWFQLGLDRTRRVSAPAASRGLTAGEWRRALALLPPGALSEAESAYAEATATLLEAAGAGRIPEGDARVLLADLNALLRGDRALEGREADLARLAASSDPARLGAEREQLIARIASATDAGAREALEQGLALVEGRLAQAADVPKLLERVRAQRGATAQALASLADSLLRLKAGPEAGEGVAAGEAARRAGETARGILQQTRAVEQAVAEVVALRGAGGAGGGGR